MIDTPERLRQAVTGFGAALGTYTVDLATGIHDLRNRLGIVGCDVQQLRRQLAARTDARTPGVSDRLESLEHALVHANRLVEELLELVCDELADEADSDRQLVDLVACAKRVVERQRSATPKRQVVLSTSVPVLVGAWEETRIAHLLHNLISNAVKYSPAGSEVAVTLDQAGDMAVIRVIDHGMGIPAADATRIFEPFFRARNAEHVAGGLGLGLASVRTTVERYGGSIEAASTECVGTVVCVHLKLTPA